MKRFLISSLVSMTLLLSSTPALAVGVGGACSATLTCDSGLTCTSGTCAAATSDGTTAPTIHTPSEYGYVNPLGTTNIRTIINRVIRTALGFVGALFLAMFVYGGALWMTAAGDEKKV